MPGREGGPAWEKSPASLVERFTATMARVGGPGTSTRKMFGYPCAFQNGNMATGLFGQGWFVRLPPDEATALLADGSVRPFEPMPGRAMKGYVAIPSDVIADDDALDDWVRRSLDFTATLPPKR